ncbi:threonine/serine exporter family protein [Virgibacillus sp. 179-BFC.A HS]|uniref:Threonine/serine exporter family protein n=1 Tax=Tigheibacillus jepli TaxID=3035914 RepID=A0ABU5CFE7_9BACI|nr:threonine/serine exporter family protein [Virgibacillus sp. 179-BFC.A HS]MDY0404592.1 threonine/serine exporter family protein [Virgibacillus sp. 179-BFC.A HS]
MSTVELAAQMITSFLGAAGFALLFNAPKRTLIPCGLIGMFGWVLYYVLAEHGIDIVPATVLAAILVAVLTQICAKVYKTPIIIFIVGGIIPLVPGGMAYNAMRHFVENDYNIAIEYSVKVMLLSGGIGFGLMFSEIINQIIKRSWK